MTTKELKKLSREKLLDLLLEVAQENEDLRAQNEDLRARLDSKETRLSEAGNIAEAALAIAGVFEAAQDAAQVYLANVRRSVEGGAGSADAPEGAAASGDGDGGSKPEVSSDE